MCVRRIPPEENTCARSRCDSTVPRRCAGDELKGLQAAAHHTRRPARPRRPGARAPLSAASLIDVMMNPWPSNQRCRAAAASGDCTLWHLLGSAFLLHPFVTDCQTLTADSGIHVQSTCPPPSPSAGAAGSLSLAIIGRHTTAGRLAHSACSLRCLATPGCSSLWHLLLEALHPHDGQILQATTTTRCDESVPPSLHSIGTS